MDKLNQFEDLLFSGTDELSLIVTLFNFIGAMLVSFLVRAFYVRYSYSLTGKVHIGSIIPILTAIVFLVIIVVKSSLALSLGLVGALSIVRFRTPIKEPEELGYLFLTIAVGLGFGAGFSLITTIITFAILIYLFMVGTSRGSSKVDGEYTLLVKLSQNKYNEVTNVIDQKVTAYKIIRTENTGNKINAYFNISVDEDFNFQELIDALKNTDNDIDFNMVESGVNW